MSKITLQYEPTCRVCGKPIDTTGAAAFDPEPPNQGEQSPLHVDCARKAMATLKDRLNADRQRLHDAAPALLKAAIEALKVLDEEWGGEKTDGKGTIRYGLRQAIRKATAKGGA
ncbi:MAG TPA: hypothetical protein VI457_07505 [Methylococcaceae bacterium]|nr:hypothetical protein [Methylococcaceae bacterium]